MWSFLCTAGTTMAVQASVLPDRDDAAAEQAFIERPAARRSVLAAARGCVLMPQEGLVQHRARSACDGHA